MYPVRLCTWPFHKEFNQKHLHWQLQYFQSRWYLMSLPTAGERAEGRWSAQWWLPKTSFQMKVLNLILLDCF